MFVATVIGRLGSLAGAVIGPVFQQGSQWLLRRRGRSWRPASGVLLVLLSMPRRARELAFQGRDPVPGLGGRRHGVANLAIDRTHQGPPADDAVLEARRRHSDGGVGRRTRAPGPTGTRGRAMTGAGTPRVTEPRISAEDLRNRSGIVSPRRWAATWPIRSRAVGGGRLGTGALLILFGLNCVDELDRTGFGILLPNVQTPSGCRTPASSRWWRSPCSAPS